MKKLKQTKAITLIALIITIIVLLILAGVTISMLTGDNSILQNAQKGSEQYKIAQGKERIELILSELQMDKITTGVEKGTDELVAIFPTKEGINNVEKIDNNTIKVITAEGYEYEVTIDENGKTEVAYTGEGEIQKPTTPPDQTAPVVSIETTNITSSSVTLTVTATDNESGVKEYAYYIGEELKETLTTNTYEFRELTSNTEYTIGVIVTDKAGNITEKKTTTIKTLATYATLKAGEYVNYIDKNGTTQKCIVLYDTAYNTVKGTNYGVQIITAATVETVELGNGTGSTSLSSNTTHFNTAKTAYNSAISTLNTRAAAYLNTTYASAARCVGSVPDNPSSESEMFTGTYGYLTTYGWNGVFRNTDTNYEEDFNQMGTLNIRNIESTFYWLASRELGASSSSLGFSLGYVWSGGTHANETLCSVHSDGNTYSYSREKALRPVFTLNSTIKVKGGDGTSDSPWELGV